MYILFQFVFSSFTFPLTLQSLPQSSYLEVAHLLIFGELPTRSELEDWERDVMGHTHLHEDIATVFSFFLF